jgi:RNA polymerase sigma-70 factor (ECF subfamily)
MIEETAKLNQFSSLDGAPAAHIETDDELVQAALAGDEAAFGLIFERYRRLVVHLVGQFFSRRETVEEIAQQAFTKIYFSLKDFRGGQQNSFAAWLSRLTVNLCYDELRRRQRRPENLFAELSREEAAYIENIFENSSPDNETAFVNRDLAEKLLAGLDAKDRLAITLYHAEDRSVAEVARAVGWSESNVKARLMRARRYLRNLVERLG